MSFHILGESDLKDDDERQNKTIQIHFSSEKVGASFSPSKKKELKKDNISVSNTREMCWNIFDHFLQTFQSW